MCETERVLETLVGIEVVKRVILGRGPSGKDLLGYFPSLVVGVSDSHSQPILGLKTACNSDQPIIYIYRSINHVSKFYYI